MRTDSKAFEQQRAGIMMKRNLSSAMKPETGCQSIEDIQTVQPFPSVGLLAKNANLPLPILAATMQRVREKTYSYVVSTVRLNQAMIFNQYGSAPNFQGDFLTLCTCKHQMRSRLSAEQWEADLWIAGFTSRTIHEGKHWLFFLAKIKTAHDSHSDWWSSKDADFRKKKAAHLHYLGDLFKPTTPKPTGNSRFSPSRYLMPLVHAHRQYPGHNGWKNDINYRHAATSRHPPLLVADPRLTFLWEEPMIFYADNHCRDYFKWSSIQELISQLRQAR
jgi:hypothetical protein